MGLLSQNQSTYYNSNNSDNYGDYQFTSLADIISGFMVAYVGESKLISKVSRTDVQFHGMRAIQEFSYDIFRSVKSQEIEVPNTLRMILPQDYVNYVKLTTSGSDGVKRNLYPTGKTSNPFSIEQSADGDYSFTNSSNNQDYRKLEITCPGSDSINDGDHISLGFVSSSGVKKLIHFIFDTNQDSNWRSSQSHPANTNYEPKFFIDLYPVSMTADAVGGLLAEQINDSSYFTAVNNNGVVSVTFNQILENYADTSYSKSGDGSDNSDMPIQITNIGGTVSNVNLKEQDESNTWSNYKSHKPIDLRGDHYESQNFIVDNTGNRYGLDPQHAHDNGTFYIDYSKGFIHFGSNLAGKTIVLDYISDGLGTAEEMVVHKFAEEAVYKWIAYGIISSRSNMPEYIVQRFKKERFAEARKAKIRLSNIKIEEFTQVLKGLSKPIK